MPSAMRTRAAALSATVALCCSSLAAAQNDLISTKRGLAFTPNSATPQDNYVWKSSPSDLTWYYNYGSSPAVVFNNWTQTEFEFVPMLWGAPGNISDTTFLATVQALVHQQGLNISNVLTFNEPDGSTENGGSNVDPATAAQVWVNNIVPLQAMGVRVGLPACTGGTTGLPWLQEFLGNCSDIISSGGPAKNCTYDFVSLHWYGNFEAMASHIGQYAAAFPNVSLWITEYNYDNQDLSTSQSFYNTSSQYLDRLTYVERYSYFGAFRSSQSNVGPNSAMLSAGGQLTDIGAWYLGREETNVDPSSTSIASAVRLHAVSLVVSMVVVMLAAWMSL